MLGMSDEGQEATHWIPLKMRLTGAREFAANRFCAAPRGPGRKRTSCCVAVCAMDFFILLNSGVICRFFPIFPSRFWL